MEEVKNLGDVVYVYNLSTWQVEEEDQELEVCFSVQFQVNLSYMVRFCLKGVE